MSKRLEPYQIWGNDGTTNLVGLASGAVLWFIPGNLTTGALTSVSAAAHWAKIDCMGADYLDIVYAARIVDAGGLGAVTGPCNVSIVGIGTPYIPDDSFIPQPILDTPATVTSAAGGDNKVARGCGLWVQSPGNNPIQLAASNLVHLAASGIVAVDANTTGTRPHFVLGVGRKQDGTAAYTSVTAPGAGRLRVSGLGYVWVAVGVFHTALAGTLVTTKIKGGLWAIREYDE